MRGSVGPETVIAGSEKMSPGKGKILGIGEGFLQILKRLPCG